MIPRSEILEAGRIRVLAVPY